MSCIRLPRAAKPVWATQLTQLPSLVVHVMQICVIGVRPLFFLHSRREKKDMLILWSNSLDRRCCEGFWCHPKSEDSSHKETSAPTLPKVTLGHGDDVRAIYTL